VTYRAAEGHLNGATRPTPHRQAAWRDRAPARLAEDAKATIDWAHGSAPERRFLHLERAIDGGVEAMINGEAASPDDDDRIRELIEKHAGKVEEVVGRLLRE